MILIRTTIFAPLVFMLVGLRTLPSVNATEPSNSASPVFVMGLVHNMARVSIADVMGSKAGSWVLVKLQPDATSGILNNGQIMISGRYFVVRHVGGSPIAASGVYSWPDPDFNNNSCNPRWDFLPFKTQACVANLGDKIIGKGYTTYALCRVTSAGQGADRFQDASWLAPDWLLKLRLAIQYATRNGQVFTTPGLPSSRLQLAALASSADPFLALAAVQLLGGMNDLSADEVAASLNSTDIYTVALIVYNLVQDGWLDDVEHRTWLTQQVTRKHSFDFSAGVAIGLGSAATAGGYDMGVGGVIKETGRSAACLPLLQSAKDGVDSSTDGTANRIIFSTVLKRIFDDLLNP